MPTDHTRCTYCVDWKATEPDAYAKCSHCGLEHWGPVFAAAPEMLQALRQIATIQASLDDAEGLEHDPVYQRAIAAITKAEGGAS